MPVSTPRKSIPASPSERLRQVHAATHPAALLGHRPDESQAAACPVSDPAARESFAALDAEAEEDQERVPLLAVVFSC